MSNNTRAQSPVRSRRLVFALALTLAVAASLASPAAAQSRAEEIAKQQADKNARLAPNVPNRTERALEWFEDHFTDPNTVYLSFGGIYPAAGFAPGLGYRHAFGQARFNVRGAYSLRNSKLLETSLEFPELADNRLHIETHARWFDATQVPFYGLGNESLKALRSSYGLEGLDVRAGLVLKPVSWFQFGASLAAEQPKDSQGKGPRPSIELIHAPFETPALFSEPRYMHATASVTLDWRESPGYTRRGGHYGVTFNDYRDRDDRFSFRRLDVDFRQFIPVLHEQWVFAFRALARTTDTDSGQVIPYYLLPSLGGNQSLRAYGDFRFQDQHLLLLSAEYRWLPSRILDMAIFVDAGKVAAERRNLDLDGLKTGYGIGARFHGPTFVPLRIDLARGKEGFRLHLTGGVPF